jgi:hypothetical protein
MRKTTVIFNQDIWCPDRNLNPGHPKRMPSTRTTATNVLRHDKRFTQDTHSRISRRLVRIGLNLEGGVVVCLNSLFRDSSTGAEYNHGNLNQHNTLFEWDSKLVACYLYAVERCNLKQTEWVEHKILSHIFTKKFHKWILSYVGV